MFEEFYIQSISYICQRPVGSIEQHVRTCVVLWSYPLSFQDSPKGFGDVQMWRVWWQEEEEETSLFPYRAEFLYPLVPVHRGIVKHDKGVPADSKGKVIKKADYLVCRHPLSSGESLILVVTGYHTEYIEPCNPLGRNEHVLSLKLPSVWHITLGTGMALIGIIKRNAPVICLTFKFL